MNTHSQTVESGGRRRTFSAGLAHWLRPVHYIIATALSGGYLTALAVVHAFERQVAGQSLLALARMTQATRDATPFLPPPAWQRLQRRS